MTKPIRDLEVEALSRRLFDARDRQRCELSFDRYLHDIRDRLDTLNDPALWRKYQHLLDEKFSR